MQINLVPKTRETESKKKQLNFVIFMIALAVLVAVGIISLTFYSTNALKKNKIKNLEEDIKSTQDEIADYSELEENITYLVDGLSYADEIMEDRGEWVYLYREIERLMPKESSLKDVTIEDGYVSFQAKTSSVGKAAELMDSLRDYEFEIPLDEDAGEDEKPEKVKLFTSIEVTDYSKSQDGEDTVYTFEFEGEYSEDVWLIK